MSKLSKELDQALKDSLICNKCGIRLNWKKSQEMASSKKDKRGYTTLRCHKCGNIIGYTKLFK